MGTNCSLFLKKDGVFKDQVHLDRWYIFVDSFDSGIVMTRQDMLGKLNNLKQKINNDELDYNYDPKHHLSWINKAIGALLSNPDIQKVALAADFDIEHNDSQAYPVVRT